MELSFLEPLNWPLLKPLIIGYIDIEVQASDAEFGIEKVEFYIDEALKETITSPPYTCRWDEAALFLHTINVVAHNNDGDSKNVELSVWKFF